MPLFKRKSILERVNARSGSADFSNPAALVVSTGTNDVSFAEFNLIRMVSEEGPKRIAVIGKELDRLREKMVEFEKERQQLSALVSALQ